MATGGNPSDYQVLFDLREELVDRIVRSGTDVKVLITRAVSKGLISLQGLEANATSTSLSEKERMEQFLARVLEAIKDDPSGERTTLFLQVLDGLFLSSLSEFIRIKLARGDTHHDPSPRADRPEPPYQPRRGAYGGQPKLDPAEDEDSGIVKGGVTNVNNDNTDSGASVVQHKMAPASTGGAGFTSLSNGVIAVPEEHSENLIVSSEDDPPAIPESDTQPHLYNPVSSSSNPMITIRTHAPVLEQTQTEHLMAQVAEMASEKECLQDELSQLKVKKEESEQKLREKDLELERVKREKDAQIQSLKAQIKEKEEKMEELQRKLSDQEKENVALKEQYETDIVTLKGQLKEMEKKYNEETLQLMKEKQQLLEEKHQLELKVANMCTQEEIMKRQISEEQVKSARLEVTVAQEQKNRELKDMQQQHQEEIDELKKQHRDSISKSKKLEEELANLKRKHDTEHDTP